MIYWHNFSLSCYIFRFIQQFFKILWYPWSIHVLISHVLKFLLLWDILVKNWQLDWKVLVKIQIIFLLFKYVINFLCNGILLYMYWSYSKVTYTHIQQWKLSLIFDGTVQNTKLGQTVISKEGKRFLGSWKHLITNIHLNNIRGNTIIFKLFSQGKMFSISSVPRFIETFSVLKSVQSCYKPYWTCKAGLRKDKPNS